MRLTSIQVYRYSIPLTTPIVIKKRKLASRQGLIIRFSDDHENSGWGEIAPLPGFSRESLEQCIREMQEFGKTILGMKIDDSLRDPDGEFYHWLKSPQLSCSVRFGMEIGVLDLLAFSQKQYLFQLYSPPAPREIYVNALVSSDTDSPGAVARSLMAEGYQTLKMKVGQRKVAEDIRRVQEIREAAGEKLTLRLDANQAWDFSDAVAFAGGVQEANIEYIEEPLKDSSRIPLFFQKSGLPVAVDESLLDIEPDAFSWKDSVKAIILKPTLLGGLDRCVQWIRSLRNTGIYPVFSSAFESGLALSQLAQLSAVFAPHVAAGLDTGKWLQTDVLETPLQVAGGRLDVQEVARQSRRLNPERLTLLFTVGKSF